MEAGEEWNAKMSVLLFQAGVSCFVLFWCFKDEELGSIAFVAHRTKERKGEQADLERLL